jgi:hypothetical protein
MPQACRRTKIRLAKKEGASQPRFYRNHTTRDRVPRAPHITTLPPCLQLDHVGIPDDVDHELILRDCNTVCCLCASSVRFRLPYFNSVLLQICCGCRCSKIMITSCLSGRMSLLNIYPCLPMPHSCTTHASCALVLDHVSRHARSES